MAVNTQKFLPGSTGTTKALPQAKISSITLTSQDKKNVNTIRVKTIQIDKMLKGTLAADKKNLTDKKKEASQKRKQDAENELEKKPDPKKKLMMPKVLPKMGFLDWIKNYIGNILLGYFAIRLLKHLPALKNFFTGILAVGEFIIEWGGKILNGLVTFIDWGYKAYDATLGFIKTIGGSGLVKIFEHFSGVVGTVVETLIYASIAIASQSDQLMDMAGDFIGDFIKKRAGQQVVQQGATTAATSSASAAGGAAKAGSLGAAGTAAVVAGAGLLASAIGEGAFQLRKTADKWTTGAWDEAKKDKNPFTKPFKYAWALGMSQLGGTLAIVGTLLDIVGAPFRYAIELIRYPFLDEAGKKKQATNLAKLDGRIREQFRQGLKIVSFGMLGGKKGDWGNIYGDKGAQTDMMSKMAGGGKASKKPKVAKKSKVSRAFRPTKKGGKKKGGAPYIPTVKVQPGKSIGGEKKLEESKWWNPLSWGGGEEKDKSKDPLEYFKKYGDKFGKLGYFGPMATLGIKALVGQKPSDREYGDAALGLSALTAFNTLGFAGGGKVDRASLQQDFIKDKLKKSFTPLVDKTLNELKKDLGGDTDGSQESSDQPGNQGGFGPQGYMTGPAGTSGDKLTMARNLMRDLGLTEAQAAGIVGNMAAESGVENGRPQGSRAGVKAPLVVDGLTGYGLVQWTSQGRQKGLWDFAKSKGHDMSKPLTMDIEYQYFLKEFQGPYGRVLNQIKKAKNVKGASTIFMQQYEIPAGYRTESKIMERYNMSQPIYEKLSAGKGTATEGVGQFIPSKDEGQSSQSYNIGGSGIVDIGKSLAKEGFAVAEHPDFTKNTSGGSYTPGSGYVSNVHSGDGHYEGRALDVTDHRGSMEDSKARYRSVLDNLYANRKNNNLKMLIHDSWGDWYSPNASKSGPGSYRHPEHMHIETHHKGGFTKSGAHKAILGERGREFVIDRDSTQALEVNFPGFLDAINRADGKAAIQVLKNYASYENRFATSASQIVPIAVPVPVPGKSSNSIIPIYGGSAGSTTDVLAAIG